MLSRCTPCYDESFFEEMNDDVLRSAKTVVPAVLKMVQPKSIIDVGCGLGTWLSVFHAHGVDTILGIDGDYINRAKLLIPSTCFTPIDLTKPFAIQQRFDLAVSLEVAEHLPVACASQFVESLCRVAPAILFSAAVPGQGGTHHVNEQWPEYWRQLFASQGFRMLDPFRPSLWYDHTVALCYRQNLFLFVREDLLKANPVLLQLPEVKDENGLMLLAPYIAFGNVGLRATVKRLPRLLLDSLARRFHNLFGK